MESQNPVCLFFATTYAECVTSQSVTSSKMSNYPPITQTMIRKESARCARKESVCLLQNCETTVS